MHFLFRLECMSVKKDTKKLAVKRKSAYSLRQKNFTLNLPDAAEDRF